jgi:hypothetical protein
LKKQRKHWEYSLVAYLQTVNSTSCCKFSLSSSNLALITLNYSFDNEYDKLFDTSQDYTKENKTKAIKKVSEITPGGGTEIFEALEDIYRNYDKHTKLERHIYMLTDGEVFEINPLIELIKKNNKIFTFHCFGFGNEVSTELVIKSAQAGNGMHYFIHEKETMDEINSKIVNAMCKIFEPKITVGLPVLTEKVSNLVFDYPNLTQRSKPLYHGEYFTYFMIVRTGDEKLSGNLLFILTEDGTVALKCNRGKIRASTNRFIQSKGV